MRRARARSYSPNRSFTLLLIPMFLIISSSVYPAIISSIENRETSIISEVLAQLKENNQIRSTDTSSHHATLPISSSRTVSPSSPTPIDPSFSSASPSKESSDTPKILSDHGKELITPYAINAGDLVHVLWHDDTPGNSDIFYKRDGADFDPSTINLSNSAGASGTPAVAVSGNSVHVVWSEPVSQTNSEIFYKKSTDRGGMFGPTINVSNNAGFSFSPAIAVSGNNVHVVWEDQTPGNPDIFYKRSINGGASFTELTKNLSDNAGISQLPAIAVSGNNVHVVWNDTIPGNNDILYRRSVDGGSTFPNIIKNLSSNAGNSIVPAIAAIGNNVHVVWMDDTDDPLGGNFDIFHRRSINGGTTFPNIITNLSSNAGDSFEPAIAVSGTNVHVVWADNTSGNFEISYIRSVDGGSGFSIIINNLSSNAGTSRQPAIAVLDNNVYVVWDDNTSGNFEILYRPSTDNGVTFDPTITNLSANAGFSAGPTIAVS